MPSLLLLGRAELVAVAPAFTEEEHSRPSAPLSYRGAERAGRQLLGWLDLDGGSELVVWPAPRSGRRVERVVGAAVMDGRGGLSVAIAV